MTGLVQKDLVRGEHYQFKYGEKNPLKYIGKYRGWHQFGKVGGMAGHVWCEVTDQELNLMERVAV